LCWLSKLQDGRDNKRSGHLTASRNDQNVEKGTEIVRNDNRLTVRRVEEQMNMRRVTERLIMTKDPNIVSVSKWHKKVLAAHKKK